MKRGLSLFALLASPLFFAATASADSPVGTAIPRTMLHVQATPSPAGAPPGVNSHTVFLNKCVGGCTLTNNGTTDSTKAESDIVNCCDPNQQCTGGTMKLGAFPYSDTVWNQTKACVQKVMAPFNITVTDVKPSGAHFEVDVGGNPGDIGCPNGVGGIADIPQGTDAANGFIPNALVFNFADVWQQACGSDTTCLVQFLCQTDAQEIAHAWNLDHVVDSKDPMTYNFGFNGQWAYHDGEVCGSDCQPDGSGKLVSPLGQTCSGTNPATATHPCYGTGGKQDELSHITSLFGASNAAPVTAKITSPTNGAGVSPNFEIDVSCQSSDPIQEADLFIDDNQVGSATSAPFTFHGGSSLKNGSHTLHATCTTVNQAFGEDMITITQGVTCNGDGDCPNQGDVCANHVCTPGSGAPGGLGTACTTNADCVSGQCGSDGTNSFCVVGCDTSNDGCPSGFGCLSSGTGTNGVCWPGAANGNNDNTGGCQSKGGGGNGAAMILLGLGFAGLILVRKRV